MEMNCHIIRYECIDSTNIEARRCLDKLDNMSVLVADMQTAGRGQGDHKWHSRPGENLTFSVVARFGGSSPLAPLEVRDSLLITQVITLALRLLLESYGLEVRIKWPNDIYIGDRKICGILIENVLSGSQVAASIIGVGLNVNQNVFPPDLPNPVSLSLLTGRNYELDEVLARFCALFCECAEKTNTAEGRRYLDESFNKYMFRLPGDQR